MATSQNVRFSGRAPEVELEHLPGASIAKHFRDSLPSRGWDVSDVECWRDSGWSVTCQRPNSKLAIVIAKVGEEWFLQIAPSYVPGFVGWLLRKRSSASAEGIQALALDVFSLLSESGRFQDFMWRWDGFPEPDSSTPCPTPALGSE